VGVLRQQPGSAARALEFALLTAARTAEVPGAAHPVLDAGGVSVMVLDFPGRRGRTHQCPCLRGALHWGKFGEVA